MPLKLPPGYGELNWSLIFEILAGTIFILYLVYYDCAKKKKKKKEFLSYDSSELKNEPSASWGEACFKNVFYENVFRSYIYCKALLIIARHCEIPLPIPSNFISKVVKDERNSSTNNARGRKGEGRGEEYPSESFPFTGHVQGAGREIFEFNASKIIVGT